VASASVGAPCCLHVWQKSQRQERNDSTVAKLALVWASVFSLSPKSPGAASVSGLFRIAKSNHCYFAIAFLIMPTTRVSTAPPTLPPTNWPTTTFQSTPLAVAASVRNKRTKNLPATDASKGAGNGIPGCTQVGILHAASSLDQVVIFSEMHLRRILSDYAAYYNQARPHLALQKDAP
jgi:hypothetical protein